MTNLTDDDVTWWSERVCHYTRKSFSIVRAMDRATYDLRKYKHEPENTTTSTSPSQRA